MELLIFRSSDLTAPADTLTSSAKSINGAVESAMLSAMLAVSSEAMEAVSETALEASLTAKVQNGKHNLSYNDGKGRLPT